MAYVYIYMYTDIFHWLGQLGEVVQYALDSSLKKKINKFLSPCVVRHAYFANLNQFLPPPKAPGAFRTYFIPGLGILWGRSRDCERVFTGYLGMLKLWTDKCSKNPARSVTAVFCQLLRKTEQGNPLLSSSKEDSCCFKSSTKGSVEHRVGICIYLSKNATLSRRTARWWAVPKCWIQLLMTLSLQSKKYQAIKIMRLLQLELKTSRSDASPVKSTAKFPIALKGITWNKSMSENHWYALRKNNSAEIRSNRHVRHLRHLRLAGETQDALPKSCGGTMWPLEFR